MDYLATPSPRARSDACSSSQANSGAVSKTSLVVFKNDADIFVLGVEASRCRVGLLLSSIVSRMVVVPVIHGLSGPKIQSIERHADVLFADPKEASRDDQAACGVALILLYSLRPLLARRRPSHWRGHFLRSILPVSSQPLFASTPSARLICRYEKRFLRSFQA
jgi:hypothetical protein